MDCNEARPLLSAALDRELEPARQRAVETHIRECRDCAAILAQLLEQQSALRAQLPRYRPSPPFAAQVREAIRVAPALAPAPRPSRARLRAFPLWQVGALAASLAFVGWAGFNWGETRARRDALLSAAIADHVRALQSDHLTDVVSTDQHTVKPWFAGKIDFAPTVVDLAPAGFPLAGGRLEYFANQRAAALVFHRRQHAIDLLIWPATTEPLAFQAKAARGFQLQAWSDHGLNYLAVSDIPVAELQAFAAAYREAAK